MPTITFQEAHEKYPNVRSAMRELGPKVEHQEYLETQLSNQDFPSSFKDLTSDSPLTRKYWAREVTRGRIVQSTFSNNELASVSVPGWLRKATARATTFPSSSKLGPRERTPLRALTAASIKDFIVSQLDESVASLPDESKIISPNPLCSTAKIFQTPGNYWGTHVLEESGKNVRRIAYMTNASLSDYLEIGLDLTAQVEKALQQEDHCLIIDAGCGSGLAQAELKEIFGSRITTVGISLHEEPHFHLDVFLNRSFEYIPAELHRKASIIFSYRALDYAFLPDVSLLSLFECLKPNGKLFFYRRNVDPIGLLDENKSLKNLTDLFKAHLTNLCSEQNSTPIELDDRNREWANRCLNYIKSIEKKLARAVNAPDSYTSFLNNHHLEMQHIAEGLHMNAMRYLELNANSKVDLLTTNNQMMLGYVTQDLKSWYQITRQDN